MGSTGSSNIDVIYQMTIDQVLKTRNKRISPIIKIAQEENKEYTYI